MTPEQQVVERWFAMFDGRWPEADELRDILAPDVRFVERPNLVNPAGSVRDLATMQAGVQAGRSMLVWQRYEIRDHCQTGNVVATRFHWSGEMAMTAGPLRQGTVLQAWGVAHYTIVDGRIAEIEQHDCYETPAGS